MTTSLRLTSTISRDSRPGNSQNSEPSRTSSDLRRNFVRDSGDRYRHSYSDHSYRAADCYGPQYREGPSRREDRANLDRQKSLARTSDNRWHPKRTDLTERSGVHSHPGGTEPMGSSPSSILSVQRRTSMTWVNPQSRPQRKEEPGAPLHRIDGTHSKIDPNSPFDYSKAPKGPKSLSSKYAMRSQCFMPSTQRKDNSKAVPGVIAELAATTNTFNAEEGRSHTPMMVPTMRHQDDQVSTRSDRTGSERSSSTAHDSSRRCYICKNASPLDAKLLLTCPTCRRRHHKDCQNFMQDPAQISSSAMSSVHSKCASCARKGHLLSPIATNVRTRSPVQLDERLAAPKRAREDTSPPHEQDALSDEQSRGPKRAKIDASLNVELNISPDATSTAPDQVTADPKSPPGRAAMPVPGDSILPESDIEHRRSISEVHGSKSDRMDTDIRSLCTASPEKRNSLISTSTKLPGRDEPNLLPDLLRPCSPKQNTTVVAAQPKTPDYSYRCMAAMALVESSGPQSISGVFKWISENVAGHSLETGSQEWKEGVRQALVVNSNGHDAMFTVSDFDAEVCEQALWSMRLGDVGQVPTGSHTEIETEAFAKPAGMLTEEMVINQIRKRERLKCQSLCDACSKHPRVVATHTNEDIMNEIQARPSRKDVFGRPDLSRLKGHGAAARLTKIKLGAQNDQDRETLQIQHGSTNETAHTTRSTTPSTSGGDENRTFTSLEQLLGLPKVMVPIICDNQLAFRDETPVS